MADEAIPTQFFHVRDLPTSSVTLYPTRAHVVRQVRSVHLQPGQNEVEIYGLSPDVDEQSLQIEGTGDATITDITTDLVPNKQDFVDVYGLSDNEDDDVDSDYYDSDDDDESIKSLKSKIQTVAHEIATVSNTIQSVSQQFTLLDNYTSTLTAEKSDAKNFAETIRIYHEESDRLSKLADGSNAEQNALTKKQNRLKWELAKAEASAKKRNREAVKAKEQERRIKNREKEERRKEARRKRDELRSFWATHVFRVVVRLETSIETPESSRRSSIAIAKAAAADDEVGQIGGKGAPDFEVSLTLKYSCEGANWTPKYEISLESLQKTASIVYRAEVRNGTSETWSDCKIVLSTSQTAFGGLEDKPPTMTSWLVNLSRYGKPDQGLFSLSESLAKETSRASAGTAKKKGIIHSSAIRQHQQAVRLPGASMQAHSIAPASAPPPPPNVELSRSISSARKVKRAGPGLFGSRRGRDSLNESGLGVGEDEEATRFITEDYDPTISDDPPTLAAPPLDFEESAWEDYGLTATYELPGLRSMIPSSLARAHKIATLSATNIILSHIAIPKLSTAAYLRCKLRNPSSSVTLLPGRAGITLDGTFLGSLSLSRVAPSQLVTIPLGVDPAVNLSYAKPTVHRSTQGIFSKERAHSFARSLVVTNNRTTPMELLVLDQVPVSQDERLRIEITTPRGLMNEGDEVKAGKAASEGAKKPWGKAVAKLKKDGEVCWTADIEKGQAAILALQYTATMPAAENIVNAS